MKIVLLLFDSIYLKRGACFFAKVQVIEFFICFFVIFCYLRKIFLYSSDLKMVIGRLIIMYFFASISVFKAELNSMIKKGVSLSVLVEPSIEGLK